MNMRTIISEGKRLDLTSQIINILVILVPDRHYDYQSTD